MLKIKKGFKVVSSFFFFLGGGDGDGSISNNEVCIKLMELNFLRVCFVLARYVCLHLYWLGELTECKSQFLFSVHRLSPWTNPPSNQHTWIQTDVEAYWCSGFIMDTSVYEWLLIKCQLNNSFVHICSSVAFLCYFLFTDFSPHFQDDTTFEKQSALFALAIADIVLINM